MLQEDQGATGGCRLSHSPAPAWPRLCRGKIHSQGSDREKQGAQVQVSPNSQCSCTQCKEWASPQVPTFICQSPEDTRRLAPLYWMCSISWFHSSLYFVLGDSGCNCSMENCHTTNLHPLVFCHTKDKEKILAQSEKLTVSRIDSNLKV